MICPKILIQLKKEAEAFLAEAKWRNEEYVPKLEEYMKVSLVSCGYQMLAAASFLGMGDIATKEVFEWISATPKIANASSTVCRLMDDIVSHKVIIIDSAFIFLNKTKKFHFSGSFTLEIT